MLCPMNTGNLSRRRNDAKDPNPSTAMPDMHHVAILHNVVFAFKTQRAFGAGIGFRASFKQLVPAGGFSANEVFFQIGVYGPRSFNGPGGGGYRPGSEFIFSGGH